MVSKTVILSFLFTLSLIERSTSNLSLKCGVTNKIPGTQSLIAHGESISIAEWPWMAALYYGPLFICGGTIGNLTSMQSRDQKIAI